MIFNFIKKLLSKSVPVSSTEAEPVVSIVATPEITETPIAVEPPAAPVVAAKKVAKPRKPRTPKTTA